MAEQSYPRIQLGPALNVVEFDVIPERWNQLKKWGEQSHPDGTSSPIWGIVARHARGITNMAMSAGVVTWCEILREEVYEAFAETEPEKLRAELVQVCAVGVAWIEDIDKRQFARIRAQKELLELEAEAEIPREYDAEEIAMMDRYAAESEGQP